MLDASRPPRARRRACGHGTRCAAAAGRAAHSSTPACRSNAVAVVVQEVRRAAAALRARRRTTDDPGVGDEARHHVRGARAARARLPLEDRRVPRRPARTTACSHGDLVLKGRGDPKITVEQWQAFMAALRARGLDAHRRRPRARPLVLRAAAHDPAAFDGEPLKPYNVGPDALLVNFKSVQVRVRAERDRTMRRSVAVDPALPNVAVGAPPKLAHGDCGDWRTALGATFVDRGTTRRGAFRRPLSRIACGEREWWVALLDHPALRARRCSPTYFRAAGGRFAGGWQSGRGARASGSRSRRSNRRRSTTSCATSTSCRTT